MNTDTRKRKPMDLPTMDLQDMMMKDLNASMDARMADAASLEWQKDMAKHEHPPRFHQKSSTPCLTSTQ